MPSAAVLHSRGVLDANGRITPWMLADDALGHA